MPVFAVHYYYADNSADTRDTHRPAHRQFLDGLTVPGAVTMLASGPYAAEPAGALLIFRAESASAVETTLDTDPFAIAQVIAHREVREWPQVFGPWVG